MKGSVREVAKLGIVHFMLHKDTIKGGGDHSSLVQLLEHPEFDAVECTWINDPATRKKIASTRTKTGKALAFGAQPVLLTQELDLNSLDEDQRSVAVAAVQSVIPQAYELGAEGFGLLSGKNVPASDKKHAMEKLVRSLVEIGDHLAEMGSIPLVLETFDQLDYGKNALIGSHRDAAWIAKEVRKSHPSFGLMIDLSHLPLQGEKVTEAWEVAGDYIVHAHMGNCVMNNPSHPMNGDEHPPLGDPAGENGVEELSEYLSVLYRMGFLNTSKRPFLSFEVVPYGDWTADALVDQSLQVLRKAWEAV